jgi:hypothetical protein
MLLVPFTTKYCHDDFPFKKYAIPRWKYLRDPRKPFHVGLVNLAQNPDFDINTGRKPPVLFFDPVAIRALVDDRFLFQYSKLDGIARIPSFWRAQPKLGDHFVLARPVIGNMREEFVQVLELPEDLPRQVEDWHFPAKPRTPLPYRPFMEDKGDFLRVTAEPRPLPRAATARTQTLPSVFPFLRDDSDIRRVRQNRTPTKIINPGATKQVFRHLVAIFKRIPRN